MSENDLGQPRIERARKAFASVAYAKFLALELGEINQSQVNIHLNVRDELKQNRGVVHGGAIASLIDTAAAFAVLTKIDLEERVATADLTIHYLRPIADGQITATAQLVRAGRRVLVVSVDVTNGPNLVATAVTSYIKIQETA
jgi:uncharacterized protein (TIGR00369 family)